ncbi:MAG: serine protease [Desulfobacterales bacterium]|nr:serine protease [Desulfobacterales bacterium]
METDLILPVILQLAGVFVIIAEIIIPSGGMLSILALGIFGYSFYIVYKASDISALLSFAAADIVIIPVLVIVGLKLLVKSPVTLKKSLSSENGVTSQSPDLNHYINAEGTVLTDLRPVGTAFINGKRVDVVSRGEYIEKDSEIVVYAVTGNQIIVQTKED